MLKTRGLVHLNSFCIMTWPWASAMVWTRSGQDLWGCPWLWGTQWIGSALGWVWTNKHSQAIKEWREVHDLPQITPSSPRPCVPWWKRDRNFTQRTKTCLHRKELGAGPFSNILILPSILRLGSQLEGRMVNTVLCICSSRSWCLCLKGEDGEQGHVWTCLVCIIKAAERSILGNT